MTYGKLCQYYLNSKCILEGGYCDLNCHRWLNPHDSQFYDGTDKIDPLAEWRMTEETGKKGRRNRRERGFS